MSWLVVGVGIWAALQLPLAVALGMVIRSGTEER